MLPACGRGYQLYNLHLWVLLFIMNLFKYGAPNTPITEKKRMSQVIWRVLYCIRITQFNKTKYDSATVFTLASPHLKEFDVLSFSVNFPIILCFPARKKFQICDFSLVFYDFILAIPLSPMKLSELSIRAPISQQSKPLDLNFLLELNHLFRPPLMPVLRFLPPSHAARTEQVGAFVLGVLSRSWTNTLACIEESLPAFSPLCKLSLEAA